MKSVYVILSNYSAYYKYCSIAVVKRSVTFRNADGWNHTIKSNGQLEMIHDSKIFDASLPLPKGFYLFLEY